MNLPTQPDFQERDGAPSYERGKKYPAWFGLAIPFIALMGFMLRHVRGLCWAAAAMTILIFEIGTLCIEHHAVLMGHWVYNQAKLLGPCVWLVPIEELLIYYLFPPLFVVMIMQLFYQLFSRRRSTSATPADNSSTERSA